jgi:hypothetical protein
MDFIDIAHRFLASQHPDAAVAALGGSSATGTATATSDLDLALLYDDPAVNYAETVAFEGRTVEVFAHSRAALDRWLAKELGERRPVMHDLWAHGILLADDGTGADLQSRTRAVLAAGPDALSDPERNALRYALSSSLDDLRDRQQAGAEAYAVSAEVFQRSATLLLCVRRSWLGHGKWLIRRLALLDDPLARELVAWADAAGDAAGLVALTEQVLDVAGGYLQAPYRREAPPTDAS